MYLSSRSINGLDDITHGLEIRRDIPELTTATVIGITVAIAGNVLISLALNLQKLAHKRLDAEKAASLNENGPQKSTQSIQSNDSRHVSTVDEGDEGQETPNVEPSAPDGHQSEASTSHVGETTPLLQFPRVPQSPSEVSSTSSIPSSPARSSRKQLMARVLPFKSKPHPIMLPVDIIAEESLLNGLRTSKKEPQGTPDAIEHGSESDYLKSKLWWLGFLLMNIGEIGNFISYAWAPASIVAPLGTFALIANCFFSPLILRERFRKRDLLGVMIAIVGAVTVVLSSNASDGRLDPDGLVHAISQIPFIVYSCIYVVGAIILATLSQQPFGQRWVLVDVGLCALFGGFTVLSTKAVSTLLTMQWSQVFTKAITYPVILVLIFTGIGQIRYLNRALMRFDSKIVIPIQFVLFNLSAIIGSAILYGDFKKASFHQIVTFLYGCAATFAGVFIIAWSNWGKTNDFEDTPEEQRSDNGLSEEDMRAEQVAANIGVGSLGRRKRATLVLPQDLKDAPVLNHKHSAVSIMGLSPAQPLLLVHTPPREYSIRDLDRGYYTPTPTSERRRALSWLGEDSPRGHVMDGDRGTRESSLVGRHRGYVGDANGQTRVAGGSQNPV